MTYDKKKKKKWEMFQTLKTNSNLFLDFSLHHYLVQYRKRLNSQSFTCNRQRKIIDASNPLNEPNVPTCKFFTV